MSSKQHWKDRAIRMEKYRDEVAEQRSQALADLDREAQEVDLLRTVVVDLIAHDALRVWGDGRWETDAITWAGAMFTPDQVEAIDRAKQVISDRNAALQIANHIAHPERDMLTAERVARGLGAVPLEDLPPDAQQRGEARTAQAAVVGNLKRVSYEPRQEAIEEVDVTVTLADAAQVVAQVRDDLLDRDRQLSLGVLALLLSSVLPRIEYQAGCEATIYAALHQVTLRHAIATTLETEFAAQDERLDLADQVLDVLRHHIPKLTATMQKEQ